MWPTASPPMLAGWSLIIFLRVVAGQTETVYKKVGDEVVLQPGPVTGPITSIVWRDGDHIAIEWEDNEMTYYRHFKVRGSLNNSTGEMTIRGLIKDDTKVYKPQINSQVGVSTHLIVMSAVPVPTVTASCDDEKTTCTLTCEGNITDVEEVTYKWTSGDLELTTSSTEYRVFKENSSSIKEFSCELNNPVSQESSKPIPNPLLSDPTAPVMNTKISTGLTVFICLLTAVLLLTFLHRWKAGMWFFEKESMPWEADFWRKEGRTPRQDAESNGTTAHSEKGQEDEETPMT